MARDHARILCRIWADDGFRALSALAQRAYILLLSQPNLNYAGLLPFSLRRWASCGGGVTTEEFRGHLAELEAARYVVVDEDTEELLVRSFIRNDGVMKLPNVFKGALREAQHAQSSAIRRVLAIELRRLDRRDAADVADGIDPNPIELPLGSDATAIAPPLNSTSTSIGSEIPRGRERGRGLGKSSDSSSVDGYVSLRKPQGANGTRLPDDFAVTDEMRSWAAEKAPGLDADLETEAFRDYWQGVPGQRGRKSDWVGTWRNWLRKSSERLPARRAPQSTPADPWSAPWKN